MLMQKGPGEYPALSEHLPGTITLELDAIDGSAAEGDDDIAPETDTDDDIAEDEE
jgi:hypothetical protein